MTQEELFERLKRHFVVSEAIHCSHEDRIWDMEAERDAIAEELRHELANEIYEAYQ
jgi:hypothetical protein